MYLRIFYKTYIILQPLIQFFNSQMKYTFQNYSHHEVYLCNPILSIIIVLCIFIIFSLKWWSHEGLLGALNVYLKARTRASCNHFTQKVENISLEPFSTLEACSNLNVMYPQIYKSIRVISKLSYTDFEYVSINLLSEVT